MFLKNKSNEWMRMSGITYTWVKSCHLSILYRVAFLRPIIGNSVLEELRVRRNLSPSCLQTGDTWVNVKWEKSWSDGCVKVMVIVIVLSGVIYIMKTRKPCYRKETSRCSMFFLRPMIFLFVICFSLRKVKAVIAPAVICRLKADWTWN